ncbi:MAG TPA: PAS domain-containing sensor histidine kinase, partial [Vicinamibacterales bacterium]|nr:PAS domain-containing sensor histidine kinase [Vicinamibacterales bacterium]
MTLAFIVAVLALVLIILIGLVARLGDRIRRGVLAQSQLAAIVESSDDAIVGKNLDGIITSWNRAAERLFGYAAGEAIGQSITMIIPHDRLDEEAALLAQIRAGQRVAPFETVRLRKDGSPVTLSITVSPIKGPSGRIVGASKIARDITGRMQAQRQRDELLEREQRAREDAVAAGDRLAFLAEVSAVLTSSLDYEQTLDRAVRLALPRLGDYCSVFVQGEHGRLRHAACGHVALEKEAIVRELVTRLVEDPASRGVSSLASVIMKTGQRLVVSHDDLLRRTAEVGDIDPALVELGRRLQPWAYLGTPLVAHGRVIGAISFGTTEDQSRREYTTGDADLADEFARRVSLAVENARLFRQADELNRLKDEFLATLSHELRTPLGAILGWTRLLATGQLAPDRVERAVAAIERSAQAQSKIVEDILDLARGTAGNLRLDMKPIDLSGVAHRGVEAIAPAAAAKQIRIDVHATHAIPVVGDATRLQQVMWNLLSNAVKFTPANGVVSVDVAQKNADAEIRVTDS